MTAELGTTPTQEQLATWACAALAIDFGGTRLARKAYKAKTHQARVELARQMLPWFEGGANICKGIIDGTL